MKEAQPKKAQSLRKKQRSKLAEIASYQKQKDDLVQNHRLPTEEETKKAMSHVLKELQKGKSLQDILGLSNYLLEEIYTMAYSFYSQGKYKEAVSLFQILVTSKPDSYKYNLGLSSCYHELNMFQEAAFGFFLTFNLEPTNPIPTYYIADSFMKANMPEESSEFIDVTLALCDKKPEYNMLKERCNIMRKSVDNMMHSSEKNPAKSKDKKNLAVKNLSKSTNKKNK